MLASAETEPSLTLRCPRPSIQAGAMNQVLSPQSRGLLIGRLARVAFLLIPVFPAAVAEPRQASPIANFTDVAEKAGLTMTTVFGGKDSKKYIIETTGTGVAIFDYDNDGWPDIFLVNGTTLEGFPAATAPTNHLYRNHHRRHREGRTDGHGLGAGSLRRRLRRRRLGRSVRHLLRQEPPLSQPGGG